jgi:hypothetical protein
MFFSEIIQEDDALQKIYEKIIFDEFHKKTKQLKQENNKGIIITSKLILTRTTFFYLG